VRDFIDRSHEGRSRPLFTGTVRRRD